jgi:hypothetical protein
MRTRNTLLHNTAQVGRPDNRENTGLNCADCIEEGGLVVLGNGVYRIGGSALVARVSQASSFVAMMKPAHLRYRRDSPISGWLNRSRFGRALAQGNRRPRLLRNSLRNTGLWTTSTKRISKPEAADWPMILKSSLAFDWSVWFF